MAVTVSTTLLAAANAAATAASDGQKNEAFCSALAHCQQGVPAGTQVCCFHGTPRPWHVLAPWVPVLEG